MADSEAEVGRESLVNENLKIASKHSVNISVATVAARLQLLVLHRTKILIHKSSNQVLLLITSITSLTLHDQYGLESLPKCFILLTKPTLLLRQSLNSEIEN